MPTGDVYKFTIKGYALGIVKSVDNLQKYQPFDTQGLHLELNDMIIDVSIQDEKYVVEIRKNINIKPWGLNALLSKITAHADYINF